MEERWSWTNRREEIERLWMTSVPSSMAVTDGTKEKQPRKRKRGSWKWHERTLSIINRCHRILVSPPPESSVLLGSQMNCEEGFVLISLNVQTEPAHSMWSFSAKYSFIMTFFFFLIIGAHKHILNDTLAIINRLHVMNWSEIKMLSMNVHCSQSPSEVCSVVQTKQMFLSLVIYSVPPANDSNLQKHLPVWRLVKTFPVQTKIILVKMLNSFDFVTSTFCVAEIYILKLAC